MIDLHSHILPGLDDGARNLQESLGIARSMADDGVRVVAATPHVRDDYPTTPEAMEEGLRRVRAAIGHAGTEIEVVAGAEIAFDRLEHLDEEALERFGLGGNPGLLLLEYPYHDRPLWLERECESLRARGVVPVIAHPERNPSVQERPDDLVGLVRAGAVVQLTAASVDGRLGKAVATCARRLLEDELAHLIASDAHAPGLREAGMSPARAAVGGGALGEWLTSLVPAALLAGEELPPRPAPPARRRGLLGRLHS